MNIDRIIAIIMTACLALAVSYENWILVGAWSGNLTFDEPGEHLARLRQNEQGMSDILSFYEYTGVMKTDPNWTGSRIGNIRGKAIDTIIHSDQYYNVSVENENAV